MIIAPHAAFRRDRLHSTGRRSRAVHAFLDSIPLWNALCTRPASVSTGVSPHTPRILLVLGPLPRGTAGRASPCIRVLAQAAEGRGRAHLPRRRLPQSANSRVGGECQPPPFHLPYPTGCS